MPDVCFWLQPKHDAQFFDVLLTVHLSIFNSIINQLDAQNFCFTISLFHASTCFEHMCSSSGGQNCITQPLVYHTYRCDDTRGCVMQFWPPDDEHMRSEHVEAWNKLIVKQNFCTYSWLITEIKKYVAQYTLSHCTNRPTPPIPLYLHAYYSGMSQVVLKLNTHLIQTWKRVPNPT